MTDGLKALSTNRQLRMTYHFGNFFVLREDLIGFAWSAPLRDLAGTLGISDVGLRKQLVSYGIPLPPQGYWNKLKAGKLVPRIPAPEARRPGQLGRVAVDQRFENAIPAAGPMPSHGPFASAHVPDDLEQLFEQELKSIGKIVVPNTLKRVEPGLTSFLKSEAKRRGKFARTGWKQDAPLLDSPLAQRQIRILNALFSALAQREHSGDAYDHQGEIHARVQIGDTFMGIDISPLGRPAKQGSTLPATARLSLSLMPDFDRRYTKSWSDDADGKLEEKIASIAASLIVSGEEKFRSALREIEKREREQQAHLDKARREQLEKLNLNRLNDLKSSGELLRQAEDIRALVVRVRQAMVKGEEQIDPSALASWERWALGEADRLDPIRSGQFKSHLIPRTLEDD
jgi:uncharacterized membrane protein